MSSDDWFLVGGSSRDPSIWRVAASDGSFVRVATMADRGAGLAVYALGIAPGGRFFAAGTRPALDASGRAMSAALLRVYRLGPAEGTAELVFERHEASAVTELEMLDESTVVIACADGFVRAYGLHDDERPAWEIHAHPGGCTTLVRVGDRIVTHGMDGAFRAFTLDGRPASIAAASGKPSERGAAMSSLAADADRGFVWAGDAEGRVHRLALDPTRESIARLRHRGEVLSVAWLPAEDWVVSAGADDGILEVMDAATLETIARVDTGAGIHGLQAVGPRRIAVFDKNERMALWDVLPEPRRTSTAHVLAARAWAGPDFLGRLHAEEKDRETERARLLSVLEPAAAAGRLLELSSEVEALAALGAPEAFLFTALLARQEGRPLDELRTWAQAERSLGSLPPPWEYLAAENREDVLDLESARVRFERLGTYRDAVRRAEGCRLHAFGSGPWVRGDVRSPEQFAEECARSTLLGRVVDDLFVVTACPPQPASGELDFEAMRDRLESLPGRVLEVRDETTGVFTDDHVIGVRWLRLCDPAALGAFAQIGVAIGQLPRHGSQWVVYCLFDASRVAADPSSPELWNAEVEQAFRAFHASPDVKAATFELANLAMQVATEAANALEALRSRY